jgi:hypothetical protein
MEINLQIKKLLCTVVMTTLKTFMNHKEKRSAGRNDGTVAEALTVVSSDWCMVIGQIAKKIGISYRLVRAF